MGIRGDRYKLIYFYGDALGMTGSSDYISKPSWEFYDLENDPHEDHNAYNDPQYGDIIAEMKVEMQHQRELVGDTGPVPGL